MEPAIVKHHVCGDDNEVCVKYLRHHNYPDVRDDHCCCCYFTGDEACIPDEKDIDGTTLQHEG